MMFVDANTVETQAIAEFKLVELVIVDAVAELGECVGNFVFKAIQ
jgi:hypothetical protein